MPADLTHITIIRRETRLERLKARWGTVGQAKFLLGMARQRAAAPEQTHTGPSKTKAARQQAPDEEVQAEFAEYQSEDDQYQGSLDQLERELDFGLPINVLDRAFASNFDFSRTAVVVVVGQDGLVANTAKYVGELPVVAVNPDPQRIDGILLPFTAARARAAVGRVLDGKYRARRVSLAEVELNDQQRMLAFNDFFIGSRSHVSARYLLTANGTVEPQSSSGVLISTGAGSTGWLSSVFNMAAGVASFFGQELTERLQWPWEERRLCWVVREPFASKRSGATLVAGLLNENEELTLESLMPEDGVIFSDGIEADFLPFTSGTIAKVRVAERQARLVVE